MKICGIVAEYNPFHNGHRYQLDYIREEQQADFIVVAMSGSFVQRGMPACLPAHVRARMALRAGADLVLELPVSVSTGSAEFFAEGAVSLLESLGCVTCLCYGCEADEPERLKAVAGVLAAEPENYQTILRSALEEGFSYPAARERALEQMLREEMPEGLLHTMLSGPNNILAIEYEKALIRLGSDIQSLPLKRSGDYHNHELAEGISSSAVRSYVNQKTEPFDVNKLSGYLPEESLRLLTDAMADGLWMDESRLDDLVRARLLTENAQSLCTYADFSPGLADRVFNHRFAFTDLNSFVSLISTKDMTEARIRRALLHMLLGITSCSKKALYARVLGFRKESSALLGIIKENAIVPLVTTAQEAGKLPEEARALLSQDLCSESLYDALLPRAVREPRRHPFQKECVILQNSIDP